MPQSTFLDDIIASDTDPTFDFLNYETIADCFSSEISEKRTFRHSIDIYLKDSNAYTNTYFSRYFEWQGVCRERWFHEHISSDMLQKQGVFITKSAHQNYVRETFPFQKVDCQLHTFDVKQCSFYLLFQFFVAGHLVSNGYQQIVFADHNKKIIRLPEHILNKIRQYEYNKFF